jgi:hypothetical protein
MRNVNIGDIPVDRSQVAEFENGVVEIKNGKHLRTAFCDVMPMQRRGEASHVHGKISFNRYKWISRSLKYQSTVPGPSTSMAGLIDQG